MYTACVDIHEVCVHTACRKCVKIHWAVPRKFFYEYKHLSLIILNSQHFWPRKHESISAKTSMGVETVNV